MHMRAKASLAALTDDVLKTSEIEGEQLSVASVRSSVARRLGVDIGAQAPVDRYELAEDRLESTVPATSQRQAPKPPE